MFSTDGEQRFRPKAAPEGGNILPSHQTHQSLWWHRRGCLWQGETIFLSFLLRQMKANCCSCYSGKLEEAMTMIVLVTRSTSLGWSDNWISQPPWVSDQGWSFRLNGKRQKYHPRSILSPGNIYEVIKMEYNKISYVKIVKYGEAGIIDNLLYLSSHGFRYDLYTGNRWKLWKGFIFCSLNDTEAIFFLKWIQH